MRRDVPGRVLEVLHAEWDAGKGAGVLSLGSLVVEGIGVGQGAVAVDGDEGVVGGVERLDLGEGGLGELAGADVLGPDGAGECGEAGGAEIEIEGVVVHIQILVRMRARLQGSGFDPG